MESFEYTDPWQLLDAVCGAVNEGDELQPYNDPRNRLIGFQLRDCRWVIRQEVAQAATQDFSQVDPERRNALVLSYLLAKQLILTEPGRQRLVDGILAFVPKRRRTLFEELGYGTWQDSF